MKIFVTIFCFSFTLFTHSQVEKDDVLLTIGNDDIKASEFVRVYNKNLDLVQDENQKNVDSYLELFINYQLKVKEARRLKLDENANYLKEFSNYKKQLAKNYMSDNTVTDALVQEAYERTTNDVKVAHVLIRVDESVTDTLAVYNKMLRLRERFINEGFEALKYDVHDGKSIFAEDLGYFGGFKMVYAFENVAFSTPVGEVSMPFRTRFGYHILKVFDKRQSLGEVTVAHIMVNTKQRDSTLDPEARINQIYEKLVQGEKFESLAKQFSDDKNSSPKGGVLAPIVGGQLRSKEFEDVAFSLERENDISKPFQTDFGWHIVKLISKKEIEPFEEVEQKLQSKVKRDSRSALINEALVKNLIEKYEVKEYKDEGLAYMETILDDDFMKASRGILKTIKEGTLISIRDTIFTYKDFAEYLMSSQRKYNGKQIGFSTSLVKEYDRYLELQLLKYHEDNLESENEDFAFVLKEYRDGLLLFDLMEKEVWNSAAKDSIGLKKFYEKNRSNYIWPDRVDAVMWSSASEKTIQTLKTNLDQGVSIDSISAIVAADDTLNAITTARVFEEGNQMLPENFKFEKGISKIYEHNDSFHVIAVNTVLPSTNKTLEESRGLVVTDFQNQIEENWLASLRKRFKVDVNKKNLRKVKKQLLEN